MRMLSLGLNIIGLAIRNIGLAIWHTSVNKGDNHDKWSKMETLFRLDLRNIKMKRSENFVTFTLIFLFEFIISCTFKFRQLISYTITSYTLRTLTMVWPSCLGQNTKKKKNPTNVDVEYPRHCFK